MSIRLLSSDTLTAGMIISLTPSDGSQLNSDPEVARFTPIVGHVRCTTGQVPFVFVVIGSHRWMVYDGNRALVYPQFSEKTTVQDLGGDEFLISILPNGGWWRSPIQVKFVSGKELT